MSYEPLKAGIICWKPWPWFHRWSGKWYQVIGSTRQRRWCERCRLARYRDGQ